MFSGVLHGNTVGDIKRVTETGSTAERSRLLHNLKSVNISPSLTSEIELQLISSLHHLSHFPLVHF